MPYQKEMLSRLIGLLWFNAVHYSSLFQYFFWSTMVPILIKNSYFSVLVFRKHYYYYDYDWNNKVEAQPYYYLWTHAYCIKVITDPSLQGGAYRLEITGAPSDRVLIFSKL